MERTYLQHHLGTSLTDNDIICRKHLLEAQRHGHNIDHIPSWKLNKEDSPHSPASSCSNPQCENPLSDRLIKPLFTTPNKLAEVFLTKHTDGSFVLCRQCYNKAYVTVCGTQCKSCGAYPKSGTTFHRHSPDSVIVSQHLTNTTGQSVVIDPCDHLCYLCYRTHCAIVESLKAPQGSDAALKLSITEWVSIRDNANTDKLTMAILQAVVYVAKDLLIGKALLLPWVTKVFLTAYSPGCPDNSKPTIETGESIVTFSARWLLQHLITYLNPYMLYKCVHMKFGTILYRKGINVLESLSWALGANSSSQYDFSELNIMPATKSPCNDQTLHEAAYIVNDLMHEEVKRQTRDNPLVLNINNELQNVNP